MGAQAGGQAVADAGGKAATKARTQRVYVDGEHGTTGLDILARLAERDDVQIEHIAHEKRHDVAERRRLLNGCDVAILCLPDDAAREAVAMIENPAVKVIDASTAHRVSAGWVYGFPELAPGQRAAIAGATRIANPGCYAVGAISMLRPLADAGLLLDRARVTLVGVSGYTGGGKSLIEVHKRDDAEAFALYSLGLAHKHLPEIARYSLLDKAPLFVPSVAHFPRGMIVEALFHRDQLGGGAGDVQAALERHYRGEPLVRVIPAGATAQMRRDAYLAADDIAGSDRLELSVHGDKKGEHVVVLARLDNLGKGAAGSAIQNLNLLLGAPESTGLTA